MIIGIDASRAVKKWRTGVENYSVEIIKQIIRQNKSHRILLYAPRLPQESWPDNARVKWRLMAQQRLWTQLRLAWELRARTPDVLFVPSHVVPLLSSLPTVVTIHDLAYKYFPESYSLTERLYLDFSTRVSAAKARCVIVPSLATKRDLVKHYAVDPTKISVIPLGYDREVFNPNGASTAVPVRPPYILYVGRIEEKKNLRLLLDAFELLCKEKTPISLVLSGKNGYGFEKIQQRIIALTPAVRSRIIQPGYLPRYDMVRYLRHAAVFAFPSRYEGFGLSVLEALAMGVPVVCSNSSSLPEVTGEAALLLKPDGALSWAGAISRIINQPAVAKERRELGLQRAQQFSWEKTGESTYQVLLDAAAAR